MKLLMKKIRLKLQQSKFSKILKRIWDVLLAGVFSLLSFWWFLCGFKKPSAEEVQFVRENVTFIYKSFERQTMAKNLYRNIQRYYPGVKVVIADDSQKPLQMQAPGLTIVQLPFNSGLCKGLNCALDEVTTPYIFRMDDDELLTPFTQIGKQLQFLQSNPQIDLVGVQAISINTPVKPEDYAKIYAPQSMSNAPKKLLLPHMTQIDDVHYIVGKCANIFLCRTDKIKQLGYDEQIRMADHNEFFYRAAGNLVSSMDISAWVLHYHNPFDAHYKTYRRDIKKDMDYIMAKHSDTYMNVSERDKFLYRHIKQKTWQQIKEFYSNQNT